MDILHTLTRPVCKGNEPKRVVCMLKQFLLAGEGRVDKIMADKIIFLR